ncbi:VOC family protein [Streptomyces sp. WMMB303]|uniref:VOC family protein n=1 Tax=unclassified Streptomyces TaxID=2593676 RepID=UPI0023EAA1D3|nr:VOC family protein [Streptomyces sp. WMMB303]MDF4251246.1 VOC family protein [Streptomyces sp. WMMB303]
MPVQLNHTIVYASDKQRSAQFLAGLLGLEVRPRFGPFLPVVTANDVALDFADAGENPIAPQHYAFLVSEEEFDLVFGRIEEAGLTYYADPRRTRPGEINRNDGGRGLYWLDPDGHVLEIITRHYGGE